MARRYEFYFRVAKHNIVRFLGLNEMHEVRTFAPCKAFLFVFVVVVENYFGFRTTNVKVKTDHSVSLRWNKTF